MVTLLHRIIAAACALALAAGLVPAPAFAAVAAVPLADPTAEPAAATEAVSQVSSQADFEALAKSVRYGMSYEGKTVTLSQDVSIDATAWLPVGAGSDGQPLHKPFAGTFDGCGHTVTLSGTRNFSTWSKTCFALFGCTSGATIENLTVAGDVTSNAGKVAAVVAQASSSGAATTVSNVRNLASVTSTATPASPSSNGSENAVGGIVGAGMVKLSSCANKGSVAARNAFVAAGGVVGAVEYGSTVASCYNLGPVSNTAAWDGSLPDSYQLWVAGIANSGPASAATVSGCYSAGDVSAPGAGEGVEPAEVAAIIGGAPGSLAAPTASGCYYLEGSAARGLGSRAAGKAGTAAPESKAATVLKRMYAALGAGWQSGGTANALLGGYPAFSWEEKHELEKFTVTFSTGCEDDPAAPASVASQTVEDGYAIAEEPVPEREGYQLRGWYAAGSATRVSFPFTPESSVTLHAEWTPATTGLASAIGAARAEQGKRGKAYLVGDSAEEVTRGWRFVTTEQAGELASALAAAEAARADAETIGTAKTPADIAQATSDLQAAVAAFQAAYGSDDQVGTKIVSLSEAGAAVEVSVPAQSYTGEPVRPVPVVKVYGVALLYRSDFKLEWSGNEEPGTASVKVVGMGTYKDSVSAAFAIAPAQMSGVDVSIADVRYSDASVVVHPAATFCGGKVSLSEGIDYTVSVAGADKVGAARATLTAVEGAGKRFKGSKTVEFNVVKGDNALVAQAAGACTVPYSPAAGTVQWIARDKALSVTGANGDVSYSKYGGDYRLGVDPETGAVRVAGGTNAGTYRLEVLVRAEGDADHEPGEAIVGVDVRVAPLSLSGATVVLSKTSFTFNGAVQQPTVASVRVDGVQVPAAGFAASMPRSTGAGSYAVTVTGRGNYTGTAAARPAYTIARAGNTLKLKAKATKMVKAKRSAQAAVSAASALGVSGAQGKLSYSRVGKSRLSVSKAGKITLPKGLGKGSYKLTVKVAAAGNGNYLPSSKKATITVKVK